MSLQMQEKALALAAAGFAVFPLSPGTKVPLEGSTGFYEASRDPAQIRAWWDANPNANIGLYPGQDFVIIDIDPKNNGDVADLELKHGILPATLEVETPSGGRHYYFRASQPLPSTNGKLLKGVDTRGLNGYVVAPGSIVDGKKYVGNSAQLVDAPEWFYTAITGSIERHPDAGKIIDGLEWDEPTNVERARQWLANDAKDGDAAKGNGSAFKTAAVVRDFGVSFGRCVTLMQDWNAAVNPPWDDDELITKIENAYLYAKRPAGAERTTNKDSLALMVERAAADAGKKGEPSEAATPKRQRFPLLAVADLHSGPPRWLVENAIVERSTVEIYGPYGSYKSFLALDLALHLSAGLTWAGHKIPVARPVLYVAGEGAFGVGARVRAWLQSHSQDGSNFRLVPAMPFFGESDDLRDFTEALGDYRPALIFFDTLSRAMAGLDENSAKDTSLFFARADELGRALDSTIGIIHHTGKDVSKGSRGNVNIPASCDTVFEVTSPRLNQATLTMKKQKDWSQWEDAQGFEAKTVGDSLIFHPAKVQVAQHVVKKNRRVQAVANILERTPHQTLVTKALATELLHELGLQSDEAGDAINIESLQKWLSENAETILAPYLLLKGTGRGSTSTWRHPQES